MVVSHLDVCSELVFLFARSASAVRCGSCRTVHRRRRATAARPGGRRAGITRIRNPGPAGVPYRVRPWSGNATNVCSAACAAKRGR